MENHRMKPFQIVLLLAGITFTTAAFAQGTKSTPATTSAPAAQQSSEVPLTIAGAVDHEITVVEKEVLEAAEAMPEDKYNFSPESLHLAGSDYKGVRTFGEQVKHIAASNYLIWSGVTGEKAPDTANEGKGPEAMKSKAEIVKFLKESFAFGHKTVATLTPASSVEPVGKNKRPKLFLATFAIAHAFDHYGQMVEYLRMNGIVPPASRPKSD
ncbi:MAG TPA: DinB family protein [Chthoniobacterales bacterium]|nr:DinB family protein [Chthoniobacterales bacterium]